jgi:SAM-dependent methyltransferase
MCTHGNLRCCRNHCIYIGGLLLYVRDKLLMTIMNGSMKEHWNEIYAALDEDELTWYEEIPEPSIKLLSKCHINKDESILDVGAGASTLIDYLIDQGFSNIIAADISEIALNKLKERLGEEKASLVRWIVDDITQPIHIQDLRDIALWHDRAVLHFLLEDNQQHMYSSTLKKVIRKGGYVIIAAFSLEGARKCSGLDVKNYDQNMLAKFLGEDFSLLEYFDYTHHMPSGKPRPYIYTLFQKN